MTDVLKAYCRTFFGYGNLVADWWFVGLEEGGEANAEKRVDVWLHRDRPIVDDLPEVQQALGGTDWFGPEAKRQSTWAMLIRSILAGLNESTRITAESILDYQRRRLGRLSGDVALLELMPLPSRRMSEWGYADRTGTFKTRREYETALRNDRVAALLNLIRRYHPPAVVFYGRRRMWPTLLGIQPNVTNEHYDACTAEPSHLLFTAHAVAHGASNERFDAIGEYLRHRRRTDRKSTA